MSGCCFDAIFVLLYMLLCMSHLFHNRTSCNTNKEKQPYTGKEGGIPKLSKTQAVRLHESGTFLYCRILLYHSPLHKVQNVLVTSE